MPFEMPGKWIFGCVLSTISFLFNLKQTVEGGPIAQYSKGVKKRKIKGSLL